MSDAPLVSIIVPCFNAEPYLAECLESALAQTHPRCEVIVVDDGSTDDSRAIAERYAPRVTVIAQPNAGAAAARNRGLSAAHGDLIQFLDADDLLASEKIALQVNTLEVSPDCVATGEWARFYDSPCEAQFQPEATHSDFEPTAFLRLLYSTNGMMHPAAWLVPRAIAERAGPWNERLSLDDDGEYFARIAMASAGIRFVSGARSFYRSGQRSSLSHTMSARAWESQFLSIELSSAALLARDSSTAARAACADRWQRFVYAAYPDAPELRARAEAHVRELGGSSITPDAGSLLLPIQRALGWKAARHARRLAYRFGYQALGYRRRAHAMRRGKGGSPS